MKRSLFLLPLLALGLTSCEAIQETWVDTFGRTKALGSRTTGCPQVAVIRDLSIFQNPPMANESSLIYSARMGNVRGNCELELTGVTLDATVELVALRGINGTTGTFTLPFFVSVLNAKDEILSKKSYEVTVTFENSDRQTRLTIPVQPRIDLTTDQDAASYRVLVGFELSPEQVDANTRFFAQTPVEKQ